MVAVYRPSAAWHFHVGPLWHLWAQFEGDSSLMAVMKSHSGSGERCSSRVPAEAETSLRHTSITRKHKTQFIYLFICSHQKYKICSDE